MSRPAWDHKSLERQRDLADDDYDDRAREILTASFVEEMSEAFFDNWIWDQQALAADTKRAAPSAIGTLRARQDDLYKELDAWRAHLWPQDVRFHIDSARLAALLACKSLANGEPVSAHAAMECALANARWVSSRFPKLRARKDELAAENDAAYYRLLQLADDVRRAPHLFIRDDAYRKAQFRSFPKTLHDSFTPPPCPEWVDPAKLEIAFDIWREHMPACVFVLFTHSLPACYLDAIGIPLLYRSERLVKQAFLAQRVYETGFFVKDVMDEDGLMVLEDTGALHTMCFAAAVHKLRPDLELRFGTGLDPYWVGPGNERFSYWELRADRAIWEEYQEQKKRKDRYRGLDKVFPPSAIGAASYEDLFKQCLEPDLGFTVRHLWGAGVLTATKVRYLHAAMRLYARRDPEVMKHGEPINQEDKAYTLLTICYVMLVGLEKLGAVLTLPQKEAFLHCWKVIGHVMGVDEELMSDKWEDTKLLYETIKNRHRACSWPGIVLTNALCKLLADLLPRQAPFHRCLGPVWIRDQLGDEDAKLILDPNQWKRSQNVPVRMTWAVFKLLLRVYFLSRYYVFDRSATLKEFFSRQLRALGNGMILCFQQTYDRQRFELFASERGIEDLPGPTEAQLRDRLVIRRRAYKSATLGAVLIVVFPTLFWLGIAAALAGVVAPAAAVLVWAANIMGIALVQRHLRAALKDLGYEPKSRTLL